MCIRDSYDASQEYLSNNFDTVIIAGKEYGTGSSRDWAAKGTKLLGIKSVLAESFERIHRSNLIGMGVLPIQFTDGLSIEKLNLSGSELVDVSFDIKNITNKKSVEISVYDSTGDKLIKSFEGILRIDTDKEFNYIRKGNILNYVLDELSE